MLYGVSQELAQECNNCLVGGSPVVNDMTETPGMHQLTIELSDEDLRLLEHMADDQHISAEQLVQEYVDQFLRQTRVFFKGTVLEERWLD